MIVTFRFRRDTSTNWTNTNPVLALGEPGLETDTRRVKYGDGATAWNSLGYAAASFAGGELKNVSRIGINTNSPISTLDIRSGRATLDEGGNFELMANATYAPGAGDRFLDSGYAGRIEHNASVGSWKFQTAGSASAGAAAPFSTNFEVAANGRIFAYNLPVYDSEASAQSAGLPSRCVYRTSTGELRIKL